LKIDEVRIYPMDILPKLQRTIPTGAISYGTGGSWAGRSVLVAISAEGLTGWGEIRPVNPFVGETATSVYGAIRDFYAPLLIGENAFEIERLLDSLERKLTQNPAALAAVDIALHDLVGRALGIPVHMLLGGPCRTEIPLEWSVGLNDTSAMIREAEEAVSKYGVPYVCVKVGPTPRAQTDYEVLAAVRRAVGPGVELGMDANTSYTASAAIALAQKLDEVRISYFEQPVPRHALGELRRIREATNVAVLADESIFSLQDARAVVAAEAADVLGIKHYKCGGLKRGRKIAAIAESAGLRVNCAGTAAGCYIEAVASAHLCAATTNHAFGAEFIMGLPAFDPSPLVKNAPIDVVRGSCVVPQLPGLGVDVDEKAVHARALARTVVSRSGARELH
jgi:muconate cycloisomerase